MKLAYSPANYPLQGIFVAIFGDGEPLTQDLEENVPTGVIFINPKDGIHSWFVKNKDKEKAYRKGDGLKRTIDVEFSNDGQSLYILDFGIMELTDLAPNSIPNTGVLWKIDLIRQDCRRHKDNDCPRPACHNRPKDYGPNPFVLNIVDATLENNHHRRTLWTGCDLQLTLMSIPVGGDIGMEMHSDVDQFIRLEQGRGIVRMGDRRNCLDFQRNVSDEYAIFIPAGKWHNVINTGNEPLKVYSIYAPPEHKHGTVHRTKRDSEEDHH